MVMSDSHDAAVLDPIDYDYVDINYYANVDPSDLLTDEERADYAAELLRDVEGDKLARAGNGTDHGAKANTPSNAPETLDALKHHKLWVGWKKLERNGVMTKVPFNPNNGRFGKCNDPSLWGKWWRQQCAPLRRWRQWRHGKPDKCDVMELGGGLHGPPLFCASVSVVSGVSAFSLWAFFGLFLSPSTPLVRC
jgi:hypothetical protein